MLSSQWRIVAVNNTGVALAAADTISFIADIVTTTASGVISRTAAQTLLSWTGVLANGAVATGTDQNTTPGTNFYLELDAKYASAISTATPNGYINYYLQEYINGAYPLVGTGILIASLSFPNATGSQDNNSLVRL